MMRFILFLVVVGTAFFVATHSETQKKESVVAAPPQQTQDAYWLTPEEEAWLCNDWGTYNGPPRFSVALPSGQVIQYKWGDAQPDGPYKGQRSIVPIKPIQVKKPPKKEGAATKKSSTPVEKYKHTKLDMAFIAGLYSLMVWALFRILKRGEFRARWPWALFASRLVTRERNPLTFWLTVLLLIYIAVGAPLLVLGIDILSPIFGHTDR